MSWIYPGSNPLSTLGDSIEGDIGGESPVRLRITGLGGLMTSNGDVLRVDIDPQTGELAAVGTDVGFAAPLRRYFQTGIYNGDFSSAPSNTSSPISDENFLPYWQFTPAASSNITASWVADSASGSGGIIRWTVANASTNDIATITQLVPVTATRGQSFFDVMQFYWIVSEVLASLEVYTFGQYLQSDATTTTGTSATYRGALDAAPQNLSLETINGGTIPSDAAWLKLSLGVRADAAISGTHTVDLCEVARLVGVPGSYLVDVSAPSTYTPAKFAKSNGVVTIRSSLANTSAMVELLDTGSTRFTAPEFDDIPVTIRGANSQTADLFVVESSAGTDLVAVTAAGILSIPGGGIRFPATQVASADANTLDDYEEGTWTPTLDFATTGNLSVACSTQEGEYLRVGNHVFLSGRVVTSTFTHTTAVGALRIGGLPFTPTTPSAAAIAGLVICSGFTGTFGSIGWRPINATTAADFVAQSTTGAAVITMATTQWATGAAVNIRIVGHYRI